jgi:hypothetical protein
VNSTPTRPGRDPLVAISLFAGVGFTAIAEYQLARTIGAPVPVAILLPVALDVYVVAAIRRSRGRDIALALVLMGVAQVSAHMLEAGVVEISVPLVAAVSVLVPLVIWRVHALAVLPATKPPRGTGTDVASEPGTDTATVERVPPPQAPAVPASEAVPVPAASRPELEAVPGAVPASVPVRPSPRTSKKTTRSTGTKTRRKQASTASFDNHVQTAIGWLTDDPELSGTAIGKRLGTGDSYGRRVRREALAKTGTESAPGPAPRDHDNIHALTGS